MLTYVKTHRNKPEVFFVKTWFDRSTRNWVTQWLDANLEQVGEATWSPNKACAEKAHRDTVEEICNAGDAGIPYITENLK
jgi:hypothetical protein